MSTRTVKCGHCGLQGHNRRTCSMPICLRNVTLRPKKLKELKEVKKVKKVKKLKGKAVIMLLKPYEPVVETCSICMDDCKGKTCTLECGHKFHTKCIFTWFKKNNNCPLCRAEVPELKKKGGPLELPSVSFLGACCQMVDEALASGGLPNGLTLENINNKNYTKAVMTMMAVTLAGRSQEDIDNLRRLGGFVTVEEW